MKQHLLAEYQDELPRLRGMEERILRRLRHALEPERQEIHVLTARVKEAPSLLRKLGRPDRTYDALSDVKDLIGIRIITFFEETIDRIAAIVEKEFEIDYARSVDKRKSADANWFGYRSLHYVCRLKEPHHLPYWFEVQIRTILQHAWAEIEHDLGYKSEASIPVELRRRFSRVASLLELADAEFSSIRSALLEYSNRVKSGLERPDSRLRIDRVTLEEFMRSPDVVEVEKKLADRIGVPMSDQFFYLDYVIRMLQAVGLSEIARLRDAYRLHRDELVTFIRPYFEFTRKTWKFDRKDLGSFFRGYSLVFLSHYLVVCDSPLEIERLDRLTRFYCDLDYPDEEETARAVAQTLLDALAKHPVESAPSLEGIV